MTTARKLGWAGWLMPLEEGWRLLDQIGLHPRGRAVVGTPDRPLLELGWGTVYRSRFKAAKTCDRQLRRMVKGQKMNWDPGQLEDWEHPDFATVRVVEKGPCIFIVAYHAQTHRIFQFVYHRQSVKKDRRFEKEVFPAFRDQLPDEVHHWEFLGTTWKIPAGYQFEFATLHLGDIRMGFTFNRGWGRKGILQCRQVYPADFALEKQSNVAWTEYFYQKMAAQYFIPRTGLRKRKLFYSPFEYKEFKGLACKARLHPFLRWPFRPIVFRTPGTLWTLSVVHEPANRMVQLHFGGDRIQADEVLSSMLENLRWSHWPEVAEQTSPAQST